MLHTTLRLSALSCALLAASSAYAADLPARIEPAFLAPAPLFTWSGFYVGANAGYGFHSGRDRTANQTVSFASNANAPSGGFTNTNPLLGGVGTPINVFNLPTTLTSSGSAQRHDGFVGGGQVGYNHQVTPGVGLVIGVEADAQYADLARSRQGSGVTLPMSIIPVGLPLFNPPAAVDRVGESGTNVVAGGGLQSVTFLPNRADRGVEWFGTVRGRLGYAIDRVLFYGTGGFAYGEGAGSSQDRIRTGWVAGAGIEYALPADSWLNIFGSSAVTIRAEGLYVSLDRANAGNVLYARDQAGNSYFAPAAFVNSGVSRFRSDDFAVVRLGLNYKF